MEDGLDDVQNSPVLNALLASQITEDAYNDATLDRSTTTDAVSVPSDNIENDEVGGSGIGPSRPMAVKRSAADLNCSDDDDFNPTAAVALKSRRLVFQGYET